MKKFSKINEKKHFEEAQNIMVDFELPAAFCDKLVDNVINELKENWELTDDQINKFIEETSKEELVNKVAQSWIDEMNNEYVMQAKESSLMMELMTHVEMNFDSMEKFIELPDAEEMNKMFDENEANKEEAEEGEE